MKKFLFILIASLVFLLAGCKNAFIYEHVVTKIAIQNEPTKTVYNVGEEADWSGLEVKAIYFDGESEIVTPDSITGFDSSVAVESQTITVTYKEKTATFTIKIEEGGTNPTKTLSSIAITTNPTKTTYNVGEEADWSGLVVTATYSDGTTSVVTPDSITGFDSSVAVDSQTITVTYKGKTATFTVKIEQSVVLSSIAITTEPAKLVYKVGEEADWSGLVVTATYSDTSTAVIPIADCNITGFNSTSVVETQTITVSYGGKTATFNIRIKPTRNEMLKHITDTFYFFGIVDYNQNSNYEKCLLVSQPDLSIMVTEMTENEKFFYNTDQFIIQNSTNSSYFAVINDFRTKLEYCRTQYDNVVNAFMNNPDKTKYLVAYKNLDTEFLEAITSLTSEPTFYSFYESITNVNAYPMTSSATDEEVEECYDIVYNLTKDWIKGEQKSEEIKVACRNYVLSLRELFDAKETYAYELSNYFNTNNPEFFKALLNYLDGGTPGQENKLGNRYTLSKDTMYDDSVLVNVYGLFVYGKVYFKNDKAYYLIRTEEICFE